MCIIQNMLRYYIKDIPNVHPLKPKVMNLIYIGKIAFNIDGMTIHFAFAITLNVIFNRLNALSDEKGDTLIKNYDQLHLLVIDGISLVGNTFIDCIL